MRDYVEQGPGVNLVGTNRGTRIPSTPKARPRGAARTIIALSVWQTDEAHK